MAKSYIFFVLLWNMLYSINCSVKMSIYTLEKINKQTNMVKGQRPCSCQSFGGALVYVFTP